LLQFGMSRRCESLTSFRVKCFQHVTTRARSPGDPPRPKQVAGITLSRKECSKALSIIFIYLGIEESTGTSIKMPQIRLLEA